MKTKLVLAAAVLTLSALPAFASFAPIKYQASRDKIAEACERLGSNGQGWGLNGDFGVYGCRNLSNGNTIKCTADGHCTDFAGDFRWKTMRKYFDGVDIHTIPPRRV